MDVLAAWTMVGRRRQLERTIAAFKLDHILYAALTPSSFANNHSSLVVLQTGADDFAR